MTTGGKTTPHAAWLIVVIPVAIVSFSMLWMGIWWVMTGGPNG